MEKCDDEESYDTIGFMFDSFHEKSTKEIIFQIHEKEVVFSLRIIGEDPGHVQSGQYLWPAAQHLSKYFIDHWSEFQSELVIELGSGAGLCGLVVSKLGDRTHKVVLTDHDPGCLEILQENITINNCEQNCQKEYLQWGNSLIQFKDFLSSSSLLLIGSDLLYCSSVVQPVFETVSKSIGDNGRFVLASSFDIGEVTHLFTFSCTQKFTS